MASNDLVTESQVTALVAAVAAKTPSGKVTVSDTAPVSPAAGSVWIDTSSTAGGSTDPLTLTKQTTTPTAATGTLVLFDRQVAGRNMLHQVGPSGLDTALQPAVARNNVNWAVASAGTAVVSVLGLAVSAVGTATLATLAVTNKHTAAKRVNYLVTTAATTAVAGWRDAVAKYLVGHAYGGFHFMHRFGPATGVASDATRRHFVGLTSVVAAPTDVNPSTIANCVGVGADSTDTNYFIMYRTGTGTVVKVDTGIPKTAADATEMYELAMFSPPGVSQVTFEFTRLSTGTVFTHTTTASLPATTTYLASRGWCSVGGTSSVIGFAFVSLYIETDY